jgi:hypothetical protein
MAHEECWLGRPWMKIRYAAEGGGRAQHSPGKTVDNHENISENSRDSNSLQGNAVPVQVMRTSWTPAIYIRVFITSPMPATWPAHLIIPDFITLKNFYEEYRLWRSPLWNFLYPVISSFLGTNIPLSILFSNSLNLCSSLNVGDKVFYKHKTRGRMIKINDKWVKYKNTKLLARRKDFALISVVSGQWSYYCTYKCIFILSVNTVYAYTCLTPKFSSRLNLLNPVILFRRWN